MTYKKLGDFNLDWTKSYSEEQYLEMIHQMDPNDISRKVLEAGLSNIKNRMFDNAMSIDL